MSKKGFTLVELLVVISIIAVLSVIGITVFTGVQKNAADAKRRGDIDAIMKAYEVTGSNGQYRQLTGADFAGGTIPVPPEGDSATYFQWGPDAPDLAKRTNSWYGLCTQLSNGSSYCKESVMGERPEDAPSPLTYAAYTSPPCPAVPNLNYSGGISCKTDFIRTNLIYIACPADPALITLLNNSCSYNGPGGSCGGGMQIYYYTSAEGGTSARGDLMNNECGGPTPVEVRLHK